MEQHTENEGTSIVAPRCGAVLVAAGRGERAGGGVPKQFRLLAGRPLFAHSVRLFESLAWVEPIVLVVPAGGLPAEFSGELTGLRVAVHCVAGGARRQDSVAAGLAALGRLSRAPLDVVLVHDVARPLADPARIERLARAALQCGGGLLAARASDTVKRARGAAPQAVPSPDAPDSHAPDLGDPPLVAETLDRAAIWLAQTPQAIRADLIARAAAELRRADLVVTDEAALLEQWGLDVALIESPPENFKITTAADFVRAEALLAARGR